MATKQKTRTKSGRRKKVMAQSARTAGRKTETIRGEFLGGATDWLMSGATNIRKTFIAAPVFVSVVTASVAAGLGWLVARR